MLKHFADARSTWLNEVLSGRPTATIRYVYDFGDNWMHTLTIAPLGEGEQSIAYPRLIAAQGRCPPEDVGGVLGFIDFKKAINNPRSRKHHPMLAWYGGSFDPNETAVGKIKRDLGVLAKQLVQKSICPDRKDMH